MVTTLLAKKSGPQDNAIATDDDHHAVMTADPTISQFPTSGASGTTAGFGSSSFGSPSPDAPSINRNISNNLATMLG